MDYIPAAADPRSIARVSTANDTTAELRSDMKARASGDHSSRPEAETSASIARVALQRISGLSKLDGGASAAAGSLWGRSWAAPEQAEARVDAIDVRTDVYSLGVLLYQVLTTEFPYRMDGNLPEMLSNIMHAAPTPPRTYVANLSLDLETIILKCLQKEPERRYQSVGELGRDLTRYLAREPIEARRDSYATFDQATGTLQARRDARGFPDVLAAGLERRWHRGARLNRARRREPAGNAQTQARLTTAAGLFQRHAGPRDRGEQGSNERNRPAGARSAPRMLTGDGARREPEVRWLLGTVGNVPAPGCAEESTCAAPAVAADATRR